MSRRTHQLEDGRYIILGWDPPCSSYFYQLYRNVKEYVKEDEPLFVRGYMPGEMKTVTDLELSLDRDNILVPQTILTDLFADRDMDR